MKDIKSEKDTFKIPLFSSKAKAGFPSPADDLVERKLDINELVVKHPASTFYVRVAGDSMLGAGIREDDILVIDRSLNVKNDDIILAILNGEFTVKRFMKGKTTIKLVPENDKYKPILVRQDDDFEVWGIVTFVIRKTR